LTPEIINVLVTLKENRAMVDWSSIGEDVEEKVVEMESKVKNPLKRQVLVSLRDVPL
jgi:hypothetical protein